jgi:hypothetical protein
MWVPSTPCTAPSPRLPLATWIAAAITALATALAPLPALAQEVTTIDGKDILSHPAGKAVLEAGRLLKAGKLADVRKASARDVREEWAGLTAAEQREESERLRERAPDPKALEADIAARGVLTFYGETAKLEAPSADGNSTVFAFVSLEEERWRVTAGPTTVDTTPVVETAPALVGAEILDHEIGKLALEYAKRLAASKIDSAIDLLSGPARAKRAAESSADRQQSDTFRRQHLPAADQLAERIRDGGRVTFEGDKAYLQLMRSVTTKNADGSVSYSSESTSLPFELLNDRWWIAD